MKNLYRYKTNPVVSIQAVYTTIIVSTIAHSIIFNGNFTCLNGIEVTVMLFSSKIVRI